MPADMNCSTAIRFIWFVRARSARKRLASSLQRRSGFWRMVLRIENVPWCCSPHRPACVKRIVWFEVGRYQFRGRNDERNSLDRLRSCWTLQNRILTEAGSNSSAHRRGARQMEGESPLPQTRRLGFASGCRRGRKPYRVRRSCGSTSVPGRKNSESRRGSDGTPSDTLTRLS
jgi:hypothetical protein